MKRQISGIITVLTLCLSLLPTPALAAETETRTDPLVLTNTEDANSAQGWSWNKDTANTDGYILTLNHVNFEVADALLSSFGWTRTSISARSP